jgi:hypothetical protein
MLLTSRCSAQSLVDSNTAQGKADGRQTRPVREHPSARDERVTELLPQEPAHVFREADGGPTEIPHGEQAADRVCMTFEQFTFRKASA